MKAVIVCASDGNTRQVAEVMGQALAAPVVAPGADLSGYDLVGFGSDIYYGSFHGLEQHRPGGGPQVRGFCRWP